MINDRQAYFNSRSLFCGLGLSLILEVSGTNFWISNIIGFIFGIITIAFVKKTNSSKIVKVVTGFIFALLSTTILSYMSSTLYLKETPNLILAVVAVLGAFIISTTKKESYKKALMILFIISLFMFLTSQVILIKETNPVNLFPLFNTNVQRTIYGGIIFYLASVTPVLCLNDISDKKNLMINYVMGALSIILVALIVVLVLGNIEATLYKYPEYGVLKRIKIFDFFSNVDNIFIISIVIDLVVTSASGVKKMELNGNLSKVVFMILLTLTTAYLSSHAVLMTTLFSYFPIILLILLILTLIPKK